MSILDRASILGANDTKVEPINIPEWGGTVYIRVMRGHERDRFEASLETNSGKRNLTDFRARYAVLVLADETGSRLFTDSDIPQLSQKSAAVLDNILAAGCKLNGMDTPSQKELEKNLLSDQSADSGSD